MDSRKRIVIVGATSGIAEHCARLWAEQPADLILVGRDAGRLQRTATDLNARCPQADVRVLEADFLDPAAIQATVDGLVAEGPVDVVLIAHGSLPDQAACQDDLVACREALAVNGVSAVLWAEAFARPMAAAGRGVIAIIGSVAGDRGRQSNYVYGSAKGMVARYAQGLQHRFAGTGVKVVLIKPGPTDTPMTAHLKAKGMKLASAEEVAALIVRGVDSGRATVYAPAKWQLIMMIIRHVPAFLFNKTKL